jgi:hypothetical protein
MDQDRPDRSADAVARRQKAVDQARAANIRAGYTHDPVLEAASAKYVAGELTRDEYRDLMLSRWKTA